jgi:hypothetical protein
MAGVDPGGAFGRGGARIGAGRAAGADRGRHRPSTAAPSIRPRSGGWSKDQTRAGSALGKEWRVHARLDLPVAQFSGLVLTTGTEGERLDRFAPALGAIALADRCYARHSGLSSVWAQDSDLIVRYGLSSRAMPDMAGGRVTLDVVLQRPGLPNRVELPRPDGTWPPARLVLVRRPEASAAKSWARIVRKASKSVVPSPA